MPVKKKFTKSKFMVVIIIFIFMSPIIFNGLTSMFTSDDIANPIYNVAEAAISEQSLRTLCEEQDFSYELLLSLYHADGIKSRNLQEFEKDLSELLYSRDYWAGQGYGGEDVFDLMIISRDMTIEGCKDYIKDNPNYKDNAYLKEVTEFKYYLEQTLEFVESTS